MIDVAPYRDKNWWPLAASVSLGPRVEPPWLRAARVKLHPELGTEAEQNLWFSGMVRSRSMHGIVFSPEALTALRTDLKQQRRVESAWSVLDPLLRRASPLWHLEAQLVRWCYSDDGDALDAQGLLRQVLRAMGADKSAALALWAKRVLPTLPRLADFPETWAIAIIAGTRLGHPVRLTERPPPDLGGIPWTELLPAGLEEITIGVRRDGKYLQVSRNSGTDFYTLAAPHTEPVILMLDSTSRAVGVMGGAVMGGAVMGGDVSVSSARRPIILYSTTTENPEVPPHAVRLITLDGRAYTVPAQRQGEAQMSKLTLQELERHLWGAADLLRGSIDSGDFKHYIFGLLFYKRLCDVWQEEYETRLEEYQDAKLAADPEEHRFHIPDGCFWADVRKQSTDIGTALNTSFRAIEDANTRLKGVFQDVDFANKERFPDRLLEALLQHFEKHRMRKSDVDSRILGDAYEYLIAKFADDAGKKGGEFYTPKQVVKLMVEILRPEEGQTVYDPACGAGGMLLETVHYMERNGKNHKSLTLFGQEKNLNTWAICKMSLFLHDIDDAFIERGDTLLEPKHLAQEKVLKRFDLVLANPPFSLSPWGQSEWSKGDKFSRDTYGCPPKSYGDLAFVQHMIASLKSGGRMAVVVPHGVLFRGGEEGKIRKGILEDDLIEAVVGLGGNLFYGTGIPAAVLFINRNKQEDRRGKILIVNGEKEIVEGKNQNSLSDENIARLSQAVHRFDSEALFCKVVSIDELKSNEHNLNVSRYVQTTPPSEAIDVFQEVIQLQKAITSRSEAESKLFGFLRELGYAQ